MKSKKTMLRIDPIREYEVLQNKIGVSCKSPAITVPRLEAPVTPNNQGSAIGF
jgi:hypothetical protein